MSSAKRVEVGALGLALLASGEFSYAHLRYLGVWSLELIAHSAWRLAMFRVADVAPSRAFWTAPLALGMTALLVCGVSMWRERRRAAVAAPKGGDHE